MPSSRNLCLTPEARDDLREILQDTYERWDPAQRDKYRQVIRRVPDLLAEYPGMGRRRDDLAPGPFSHPAGQHILFYRVTDHELVVRRIVHHRRDIDAIPFHDG